MSSITLSGRASRLDPAIVNALQHQLPHHKSITGPVFNSSIMNRDVNLAIFSFAALMVSLVVVVAVLCMDHEEVAASSPAFDRQLLDRTRNAEPDAGGRGSNLAFHWLMERVICGEL